MWSKYPYNLLSKTDYSEKHKIIYFYHNTIGKQSE